MNNQTFRIDEPIGGGLAVEELRQRLRHAVSGVQPSPDTLDRLRTAVPARRHRRQALAVGSALSMVAVLVAGVAMVLPDSMPNPGVQVATQPDGSAEREREGTPLRPIMPEGKEPLDKKQGESKKKKTSERPRQYGARVPAQVGYIDQWSRVFQQMLPGTFPGGVEPFRKNFTSNTAGSDASGADGQSAFATN